MAKVTSKHIGYFEIDNRKSVYKLMDKLNPAMNQDELAEFYERQKEVGDPLSLNSRQVFQIMVDAMESKKSDLMNFLYDSMSDHFILTTSRAIYNPIRTNDEVVHNYGTSDFYSVKRDIVGREGFIEEVDNKEALESFLETQNYNLINRVSNAINKTPMYLGRVNSKPSKKIERVVGFFAVSGGLYLDADRYLSGGYPSFGYELVEQKK